jgi:hypothetical protein
MALTNTQTNGYAPWMQLGRVQTPQQWQFLQTAGSGATAGAVPMFASGTAADDFLLTSVNVSILNATANALFNLYACKTKIATYPTLGAAGNAFYSHSFPTGILVGEVVTTYTAYIQGDGSNTATVQWIATGMRKI